ncbi:hypothetical protein ABEB36_001675 [Hypothenemus hampei]|uniref:Nuclear envelope membrane protein n=1 Tax=Hypothenemus hampei TaxID=57062 RepID=A0ABD1FFB5_HYPHA
MVFSSIANIAKVFFALVSFIGIFYVTMELTYFLSFPKKLLKVEGNPWLITSRALLQDMFLLTIFIFQHSFMASTKFKEVLYKIHLGDITRSIYVAATAGVFWIMLKHWKTTVHFALWEVNLNYKPIFYLYFGIHVTAWIIIYVANICTDVTELLGLKQVYYSFLNLPDPNLRKSYRLRQLTSHMRHPSLIGFLLVFWIFPFMTLDRILLASILTCYMYIAWNTDGEDYHYQKCMYQRKYFELKRMRNY